MKRPIPYDEDRDPEPFWKEGKYAYFDPFDKFVPKGFLSDLVYFFRGTEVPTVYCIWAGLSAVSAVIKREAWMEWFPGKFFNNLYVIIMGPPSAKKGTILDFVIGLLRDYHMKIPNADWREVKRLNILKNKASPEGILEMMLPKGAVDICDDGEITTFDKTSEIFIGVTEMSTMINKQKYNDAIIPNLLDLYDCHGVWEWTTKSEKKKVLKNLYTNFIAATTPSAFKSSIPTEAIGDGFLSRTVIANAGFSDREFWRPIPPKGAPDREVLLDRLAYISQAVQGTYKLSKEADEFAEEWYSYFKEQLRESGQDIGILSRQDNKLLKVAFLIHAQSYPDPEDKEVSLEVVKLAKELITISHMTSYNAINEVKHSGEFENLYKVKAYIMERVVVMRKKLQSAMRMPVQRLNEVLWYMYQQGEITVWDDEDCTKGRGRPSNKSTELYKYEGKIIMSGTYADIEI